MTGIRYKAEKDYMDVIISAIKHHPRSLQTRIGPSEMGCPCDRKIAYRLMHTVGGHGSGQINWKATVGTAVHAQLADWFDTDNQLGQAILGGRVDGYNTQRWMTEQRLVVGKTEHAGTITGSADLYDRVTCTVYDHKIVGPTQLKSYKANGPSEQYRVQAHLYGRGYARLGYQVSRVMIAFLPRDGALQDAYIWSEPWDEKIAEKSLDRLDQIAEKCDRLGRDAVNEMKTAPIFCISCPFYKDGSTCAADGCPGDPHMTKPYYKR